MACAFWAVHNLCFALLLNRGSSMATFFVGVSAANVKTVFDYINGCIFEAFERYARVRQYIYSYTSKSFTHRSYVAIFYGLYHSF